MNENAIGTIVVDCAVMSEMTEAQLHASQADASWTNMPSTTSTGYALQFRHHQKANSLFGDGRVEL